MQTFSYTIQDPVGIHARPAGLLVKQAKTFSSEITIEKDGRTVGAANLMKLMGLGIKCGDTIRVNIAGEDEAAAAETLKTFFQQNL